MEFVDKVPEDAKPINTADSLKVTPQEAASGKIFIPNFVSRKPVKFQNTDGTWVGMAQPKVALTQFIHGIMKDLVFADENLKNSFQMKITALLHVSDIDDKPVERPENYVQYLKLEQTLGLDGVDLAQFAWLEAFPPITSKQLVLVGK